MALYQLVYVSHRSPSCTDQDLELLLAHARDYNLQHHITGILLTSPTHFFQYLEGDEREVLALHKKIKGDARHDKMVTISSGTIEQRAFEDWAMRSEPMNDLTPAGTVEPDMFAMLWRAWCQSQSASSIS